MVDKVVDVAWRPQEMSNASEGKIRLAKIGHLYNCKAYFKVADLK